MLRGMTGCLLESVCYPQLQTGDRFEGCRVLSLGNVDGIHSFIRIDAKKQLSSYANKPDAWQQDLYRDHAQHSVRYESIEMHALFADMQHAVWPFLTAWII